MTALTEPSEQNLYLVEHVNLLRRSLRQVLGRDLIDSHLSDLQAAREVYHAPFVVVSHNAAVDPIFSYGNRAALQLFEMTWAEFTALPSRQSAEPPNQAERAQLLETVSRQDFVENYSGVRISKQGRRFRIAPVTIWNLRDQQQEYCGQAAIYSTWTYLESTCD